MGWAVIVVYDLHLPYPSEGPAELVPVPKGILGAVIGNPITWLGKWVLLVFWPASENCVVG